MGHLSYYQEKNNENTLKLRNILSNLPPFCGDFFRAVEDVTSSLTRLNYAYDLRLFFQYLTSENTKFASKDMRQITLEDLNSLELQDFEYYVEYLGYYFTSPEGEGEEQKLHQNAERGKARKIASLRTFFKYFYKKQQLDNCIPSLLDSPKLHDKAIIRLDTQEIGRMISAVRNGEGLTDKQKTYHQKSALRDTAIVVLLLTTGIRVSELVGLDIGDINLKDRSMRIIRKGGNEAILYYPQQTADTLLEYLEQRKSQGTYAQAEPLFLSLQQRRITVRAVENLIKKYAKIASPLKNISPHKLRSTYGTMLYQNTGDIYLVADVLGHKDVNTTRKHYAAMLEENRRRAAEILPDLQGLEKKREIPSKDDELS